MNRNAPGPQRELKSTVVRNRTPRRTFAKILLVAGFLLGSMVAQGPKPKLYVYLPSNIRPYTMQRQLQELCPELHITVFGHHREFDKAVKASPPHAVLVPNPVAQRPRYRQFEKILAGTLEGKREEALILVSRDAPVNPADLKALRIGVVDIMGWNGMHAMVAQQLDIEDPDIKPVSRLEDLLSLLQVREADAIMVPQGMFETYYRRRSRLELFKNPISGGATMGLPVVAVREDVSDVAREVLVRTIQQLGKEQNTRLRVDAWEVP